MIFIDEDRKKVILGARKCGLTTLSRSVTKLYRNRISSAKYLKHNLDHYWLKWSDQQDKTTDFSFWKDYDVTLVIREPYERYVSGLRTIWKPSSGALYNYFIGNKDDPNSLWVNKEATVKENNIRSELNKSLQYWWDNNFKEDYSFGGEPHVGNWLENTMQLEFKTLEVVDTNKLSDWQEEHGFPKNHFNVSTAKQRRCIKEFIHNNHEQEVKNYLEKETEVYNYWLTSEYYYSKIVS